MPDGSLRTRGVSGDQTLSDALSRSIERGLASAGIRGVVRESTVTFLAPTYQRLRSSQGGPVLDVVVTAAPPPVLRLEVELLELTVGEAERLMAGPAPARMVRAYAMPDEEV